MYCGVLASPWIPVSFPPMYLYVFPVEKALIVKQHIEHFYLFKLFFLIYEDLKMCRLMHASKEYGTNSTLFIIFIFWRIGLKDIYS